MKHFILALFLLSGIIVNGQSHPKIPIPVEKFLKGKIRCADIEAVLQYHIENKNAINSEKKNKYRSIAYRGGNNDQMIFDDERAESEVHAAMNPQDSNNIVIATINQDPTSLEKPLFIKIYYTEDFGDTWKTSNFDGWLDHFSLPIGGGDPLLSFNQDGKVCLSWLILDASLATFTGNLGIYMAYSEDGGKNWESNAEPLELSSDFNLLSLEGIETLVDKPWMVIDHSNQNSKGNLYLSYTRISFDDKLRAYYQLVLKRQLMGEDEFDENVYTIADSSDFDFIQFSNIDYSSTGDLHAIFIASPDSIEYGIYHAYSTNEGINFSSPKKISSIYLPGFSNDELNDIEGIAPNRLYPCPMIKSVKTVMNQSLHCTWTANGVEPNQNESMDVLISSSVDNGQSWTIPKSIFEDTDDRHQYYASLETNETGLVIASFYDRRDDPQNLNTHQYIAISDSDGDQFEKQIPVSSESSDFSMIGMQNGSFGIGEYTVTLSTPHTAIPIWSDGRNNDGDINIYMAKVGISKGAVSVKSLQSVTDQISVDPIRPNPVFDHFNTAIKSKVNTKCTISIFNMEGLQVHEMTNIPLLAGQKTPLYINCSAFPAGTYILRLSTDKHLKSIVFERME